MLTDPDESIRTAVDKILHVHIRNHGAKATELIEKGSKKWLFVVLK